MTFSGQRISIEEARQADLVDYLSKLAHQPSKIKGDDYWYLSPLRDDKTPSFKVNRKLNRWYDHGIGKGGNIIDFAILYNNCPVGEFLHQLRVHFSFQKSFIIHKDQKFNSDSARTINIPHEKKISSLSLLRHLLKRSIPIDLAEISCKEVIYDLNLKKYFAIGFKNNSGGYELRNPYFKGSSSPKDITTFDNNVSEAIVFKGFIDFLLSWQFIKINLKF